MDLEGPTSGTNEREKSYSPLVRRLAEEFDVDLSTIKGTGPGGRVTRADVQTAAESPPPASTLTTLTAVPDPPGNAIAEIHRPHPSESDRGGSDLGEQGGAADVEDPHVEDPREEDPRERAAEATASETFTVSFDVDVSQLVRAQWRLEEVGDLVMPIEALFAALALPALDQFPTMRARIDNCEIVITDHFDLIIDNVGVGETYLEPTTSTPAPLTSVVLSGTEKRSLPELADLVTAAIEPAPSAPLALAPTVEHRGSFTIDHVGSTGATSATPVLRPATTAAVAYGRARSSLHLIDGTPQERTMMVLGGTFDRRATTTGEAGHFMACLATYLEDPLLAFTL